MRIGVKTSMECETFVTQSILEIIVAHDVLINQ